MLFNSLQYAVFLPIVVVLYFLVPARAKIGLLLVASYLFYASWSPIYLLLIGGLTLLNYLLGLLISRNPEQSSARTTLFSVGVVLNLLALGYYKYISFVLTNVAELYGFMGLSGAPTPWSPILPLGLSFFVFEFIHYLFDVRNGQSPMRSLVQFAVFAAFFPTQVAGPIKRFETFLPQLNNPAPFSWENTGQGMRLIVLGLFKKVAIADNLAPLVEIGFSQVAGGTPVLGPLDGWLVAFAFALQIYFDFSGYTDMGRGSALMLGYTVPENFARPYMAANISDFWRRWHMSLSSWLRDYLYIPLGGNRGHRERNLFVTMVLGGLWHGASWNFIIWGGYHGLLLVIYWKVRQLMTPPGAPKGSQTGGSPLVTVLLWLSTFLLVCIGWIFFRAETFVQAIAMLGSMFGLAAGSPAVLQSTQRLTIAVALIGVLVVEWVLERNEKATASAQTPVRVGTGADGLGVVLRPVGWTLLFMLTLLLQPATAPRFIYFQF